MSSRSSRWIGAAAALAATLHAHAARAGEESLVLPDLRSVSFLGVSGWALLLAGIAVSVAGLVFGLVVSRRLERLPVHRSMRDVSELIYATCKTYLVTQGKFIALLWAFIGVIMVIYFGALRHLPAASVIAVVYLVLFAGFQAVPPETVEAAQVDGAGSWTQFRHIELEYLRPLLLLVLFFRLADVLRVFDAVYVLTGGGPGTTTEFLSLYLYRVGFRFSDLPQASALAVLVMGGMLVFYNAISRFLPAERV